MADDVVELKEDASFEILPYIEDDEYCSVSLNSSMWKCIQFESRSNSSGASSETDETAETNLEGDTEAVPKHSSSYTLDHSTPYIHPDKQSLQNTDFSLNTKQHVDELSENCQNSPILQKKNDYSCVTKPNVTESVLKKECHLLEIEYEKLTEYQQIEGKTEMYLRGCPETLNSSCNTETEEIVNIVNRCPERIKEHTEMQIYTGRETHPKKPCPVLIQSLKVCRWLRNNKHLQNLIEGAKSSFYNVRNLFEMEMNLMLGTENSLRIVITADVEECRAIQEAFIMTFRGPVRVSRFSEIEDASIPLLPVGYNSALHAVQSKINNTKRHYRFDERSLLLSTTTFIVESVPQRWQMSTVICLEDPDLGLNLHNFSVSTPLPNEYICLAECLTPKDYPLKERGLAVTLKDVLRYVIKTDSSDMQEFLSGVNHSVTLKSAARILAGMYNKYVNL